MSNIFFTAISKIWWFVRVVIQGDGVSSRFFRRHLFATCFILLVCVLMIAMRFDCLTSDNTIAGIKNQIELMKTEKQRQRSLYMTMTRESAMMHLVDSLRLGLTVPDKHPEVIRRDATNNQ